MPSLQEVTLGEVQVSGMLASPSALRARCSRSDRACVVNRATAPFGLVAVNSHWTSLCGYAPSEAIGKSPSALLHGAQTDKAKASHFTTTLMKCGSASVTLINYTKLGRPFVHRIHAEKIVENGYEYFVTESLEEDDDVISDAVLQNAGLQTAVRSEMSTMGIAFVLAFALIFALFLLSDTYAAAAMRHNSGGSASSKYDGYEIQDPYFFSVFDHGLPLVG